MYLGVVQNHGCNVHDYVVTGDTISEVVEKMKQLFTDLDIPGEFEEDEITFYRAEELIVEKRVEYVITGEIAE